MDRKFLEGLGIEKENIEKIMAQYGTDVTGYQTQIGTKDETIKVLRDDVIQKDGRIAELEKVDVEDLQGQLKAEKEGREKDKKEFVLRSLMLQEGCTDVDYLLFKLGDTVEFDDKGQIKDQENFVKSTKEKYASQFQDPANGGGTGGTGNFARNHSEITPPEKNPYTEKGWNLTEQMKLEVSDPDKAKKLKIEAKVE
nr:MAG TPA: minor structural protein [Caudoviricetes sp.]